MSEERQAVGKRYDRVAAGFSTLFSPVIRPFALPLLDRLDVSDTSLIVDVGCGTGALTPDWRRAAPHASIVGFDASPGMLAIARPVMPVAAADASALPAAGATADASITVFMLHHIPDPDPAVREMLRLLRPGGRAASVTWGSGSSEEPENIFVEELDAAGAPAAAVPRARHDLFDSAEKMHGVWSRAGATTVDAWELTHEHRWPPDELWTLLTSYGSAGERYAMLDPAARARVRDAATIRVAALGDAAFVWRPTIVYAIARV